MLAPAGGADKKNYGYSFNNGNLQDPVTGNQFNTLATIHAHSSAAGPSYYNGHDGYGDLGFAAFATPNKPAFVMQNNSLRSLSFVVAAKNDVNHAAVVNVTTANPSYNGTSIRNSLSLRSFIMQNDFTRILNSLKE